MAGLLVLVRIDYSKDMGAADRENFPTCRIKVWQGVARRLQEHRL